MLCDAAVEPSVSTLHGFFHIVVILGFGEVVEGHVNIGADGPLGPHAGFGRHFEITAVDMGFEFDALFGDFDIGEAENLEAARIGESGAVPAAKFR